MDGSERSLSQARQRKHVLTTPPNGNATPGNGGGQHDSNYDGVPSPSDSPSGSLTKAKSSASSSKDPLLADWKSADSPTSRGKGEHSYAPMLLCILRRNPRMAPGQRLYPPWLSPGIEKCEGMLCELAVPAQRDCQHLFASDPRGRLPECGILDLWLFQGWVPTG